MKVAFTMRLPEPLYKKVEEIAEKEKRSLSAQIELFIEKYFSLVDLSEKTKEGKNIFQQKTNIESNNNLFNINPKAILNMNISEFEELKKKLEKVDF